MGGLKAFFEKAKYVITGDSYREVLNGNPLPPSQEEVENMVVADIQEKTRAQLAENERRAQERAQQIADRKALAEQQEAERRAEAAAEAERRNPTPKIISLPPGTSQEVIQAAKRLSRRGLAAYLDLLKKRDE